MKGQVIAVFMLFAGVSVLGFSLKWMGYLNQWLFLPYYPNILDLILLVFLSTSLIIFGITEFYGWKVEQRRSVN